jgi:UDP-N-acetylglucosamine diphosphorylase / glucose-1-phosphate thymidylyltransferase / UDP-N-acetylgalactosamine diphosphorylase / glucosamine-1-phosphate N-acetyltransferase / galactosamine-1-phosphate N-acetyltransferase
MPHPASIQQAVVLAAGDGTRLRPLTDRIPKPFLPIDGQPVLARVLDQLAGVGVRRITVVVGHRGQLVEQFSRAHARERLQLDELSFVVQQPRRGSADALQLVLGAGAARGPALVCAADTAWRDEDVAALVQRHAETGATATMALQRWPVVQLPHSCRVLVDEDGRVQRVLDHVDPSDMPADAIESAGSPLYAFEPAMWDRIRAVQPSTGGTVELWRALQAAIDDGNLVQSMHVSDARDLTRPDDLLRHNFPYLAPWLDAASESC